MWVRSSVVEHGIQYLKVVGSISNNFNEKKLFSAMIFTHTCIKWKRRTRWKRRTCHNSVLNYSENTRGNNFLFFVYVKTHHIWDFTILFTVWLTLDSELESLFRAEPSAAYAIDFFVCVSITYCASIAQLLLTCVLNVK